MKLRRKILAIVSCIALVFTLGSIGVSAETGTGTQEHLPADGTLVPGSLPDRIHENTAEAVICSSCGAGVLVEVTHTEKLDGLYQHPCMHSYPAGVDLYERYQEVTERRCDYCNRGYSAVYGTPYEVFYQCKGQFARSEEASDAESTEVQPMSCDFEQTEPEQHVHSVDSNTYVSMNDSVQTMDEIQKHFQKVYSVYNDCEITVEENQSVAREAGCPICGYIGAVSVHVSKPINGQYQQRACIHGYPAGVDLYSITQEWTETVCSHCEYIISRTEIMTSYDFYQCKGQFARSEEASDAELTEVQPMSCDFEQTEPENHVHSVSEYVPGSLEEHPCVEKISESWSDVSGYAICSNCGQGNILDYTYTKELGGYYQRPCQHNYPAGVDLYKAYQDITDRKCEHCGYVYSSTVGRTYEQFYQCKGQFARSEEASDAESTEVQPMSCNFEQTDESNSAENPLELVPNSLPERDTVNLVAESSLICSTCGQGNIGTYVITQKVGTEQRPCSHGYPTGVDIYQKYQDITEERCDHCGRVYSRTPGRAYTKFDSCRGQYARIEA